MFADMNTAWILAQQRMRDEIPSEYELIARREMRRRRLARRAWWRALMRRAFTRTIRAKRTAMA